MSLRSPGQRHGRERANFASTLFGQARQSKEELFEVAPEKIVLAIRMGEFTEVTPGKPDIAPDEEAAAEKAEEADTKRRSRINLQAIGIPLGTQLTLSRGKDVYATVVEGNKVQYEGQIMSLSAAALTALHKLGYKSPAASGSDYWMYDGKTLDEVRMDREAEQFEGAQVDA
jgi:hypothetical protein